MHTRRTAQVAIFSLPLIWGSTFSIVQISLKDVSPTAFVAIRFSIAALFFLIVSPAARRGLRIFLRPRSAIERRFRTDMYILGTAIGAGYIFQTIGLLTTTSSKSAFLTSTTIIWTPILTILLGRERLTPKLAVAVLITLVGIFLLTNPFHTRGVLVGDILSVGCAMSFGVYITWIDIAMPRMKKISASDHEATMMITSTQLFAATVLFLVLVPLLETPHVSLSPFAIETLFFTALASTVLTAYLQNRYQHYLSPTAASIVYMLEPVVAVLIAAIFLEEHLGQNELLGGGLIILGVIIAQMKFRRESSHASA